MFSKWTARTGLQQVKHVTKHLPLYEASCALRCNIRDGLHDIRAQQSLKQPWWHLTIPHRPHQCLAGLTSHHADSKVHGANMGPIWGWQDPDGPHVGPMNFAIWDVMTDVMGSWTFINNWVFCSEYVIIFKSPQYTGGDFMFLYRFVRRRRRRRRRRRPQILVHAITFEQFLGFLSFLAQLLALTCRLPNYIFVDFRRDLDLDFSKSNMEFAISQPKMVRLPRNEKQT